MLLPKLEIRKVLNFSDSQVPQRMKMHQAEVEEVVEEAAEVDAKSKPPDKEEVEDRMPSRP